MAGNEALRRLERLGIHMPGGSKIDESVDEAAYLGLKAIQVFLSNPRSPKSLIRTYIKMACQAIKRTGMTVIVHAPYIINLTSDNDGARRRSIGIVKSQIKQAAELGAYAYVAHCGAGKQIGRKLVEAVEEVSALHLPVYFALENDAGSKSGTKKGTVKRLVKLQEITDGEASVCVDTAHAFAAGEELEYEDLQEMSPCVVHLNEPDPNVRFGLHLDRHNTVFGDGQIGLAALAELCRGVGEAPIIVEASAKVALESIVRLKDVLEDR